jgi:hypothetical protein
MSYFIPDESLENLNHSDFEVRRAALKKIKALIENNITFNELDSQSNGEISVVNLGLLVKKLIRYFGIKPLFDEDVVLDLLFLILKVNFH